MVANSMVTASTAQPQANPPGWVDVINHQHIANGPHRSTIRGRVSRVGPARRRTRRPADEPVGPSTDMPPAVENALRAPSVMLDATPCPGSVRRIRLGQDLMMLAQRYGQEVARDLWHYLGPAPGCTY